ncbi:hypothetical protein BJ508DRAFT_319322 [Ascobolus immersus RN42]|uniref:Poly A polymerase C-terminal region-like protein n=1 Tax=Ascobolus immersus RN42 TaxID=1160509 RepID=A0A3N4I2G1_ASCIM|nr:hypothetical protein BJ508DRAFT_319322 [Ascobolus immersus RN42]
MTQPEEPSRAASPSHPPRIVLTKREALIRQILKDLAEDLDKRNVKSEGVDDDMASEPLILRWAGGWVRDKLLTGKSNDIDVAINKMTGFDFAMELKDWMSKHHHKYREAINQIDDEIVGDDHGNAEEKVVEQLSGSVHKIASNPDKSKHLETATTKLCGLDIDLVNLRSETYSKTSRIPIVKFGTPEQDAKRRDATVNALFYNIHSQQVEDFTGQGLEDLQKKFIRTPLEPEVTFEDDPLRILRLIRFASRLDFQIVDYVKSAMQDPEIQKVFPIKVSRERVGVEFEKMMTGRDPRLSLSLIHHLGLYKTVFAPPALDFLIPNELNIDEMYTGANILDSLLKKDDPLIRRLLESSEDHYFGWMVVAMLPWAKLQLPFTLPPKAKQEGKPEEILAKERERIQNVLKAKSFPMCPAPAISAKDSLKLSSKVVETLKLCFNNTALFHGLAAQQDGARSSRADLGMDLRACFGSWRLQAFTALMLELVPVCLETQGRELGHTGEIFAKYSKFVDYVHELNLQDAHLIKPCINGTDLARAVDPARKAGPWLKQATEDLVKWQFGNPDASAEQAHKWIEEGGLAHVLEGIVEQQPLGKKKKKKATGPVAKE